MSDYPLWAYRQQLEYQARQELNYGNPYMDQKQNFAIKKAIDEKVQELGQKQQNQLKSMINDVKKRLL